MTALNMLGIGALSCACATASVACRCTSQASSGAGSAGSIGGGLGTGTARAAPPQPLSPNIVVDQFGYRPADEKIAVVRRPERGFDTGSTFTPGPTYTLVDARSGRAVYSAAPVPWHEGATDASSGDKAWWFDFSSVRQPGEYFVVDEARGVRSDVFTLSDAVYRDVLQQAVRMLFYQRDGFAKEAQYAGAEWADGAAHLGRCYHHGDPNKVADKDLHGGWWDAGDFNKYTNWGAEDVIELLRAYRERPGAFLDDSGIPESGNGVPDLLDETKWELDWLVRMQETDGSVLSIVGEPSPVASILGSRMPSTVTAPCSYGPPTTAASFSTAAAFAYASLVFAQSAKTQKTADVYPGYAADLATRATRAYAWAAAHRDGNAVVFYNAQTGVGAGEQEVGAAGLPFKQLEAALYLFELTGDLAYRADFDATYAKTTIFEKAYADPYHSAENEILLGYAMAPGATALVAQRIRSAFGAAAHSADNLDAVKSCPDPYGAYLTSYVWGSNQVKADQGNLLYDVVTYGIEPQNVDAVRGAERYIHYIHGVNPLQLVYLSNMGGHGAIKSVSRIFHAWFAKGSPWEAAGVSKYGPPPGYLVGGPNPSYKWDACCPFTCSHHACGTAPPSPPAQQPDQKSYLDFNDDWPLDSWQVTEPDDGYQAKYIRLLSKFVP
jgi:endoglucanase